MSLIDQDNVLKPYATERYFQTKNCCFKKQHVVIGSKKFI